jgi:hypothetical protein
VIAGPDGVQSPDESPKHFKAAKVIDRRRPATSSRKDGYVKAIILKVSFVVDG